MARQISYDPNAVKAGLLSVFFSRGYRHASLSELEEATGLNRRQLYNGIGDKKAMLLDALINFSEQAGRRFLAPLEVPEAGIAEIEGLLASFVGIAAKAEGPVGCLVCNIAQEEIAGDDEVRPLVEAYFDRIRDAYRNALTRAATRGEVAMHAVALDERVDALFGTHVALCVLARAGRPHAELVNMARAAVADLK